MSTTPHTNNPKQDIAAGKWKQHAGSAKTLWGKLTNDEILKTEGRTEKLAGLVQERYGVSKEVAHKQVDDFMAKLKS